MQLLHHQSRLFVLLHLTCQLSPLLSSCPPPFHLKAAGLCLFVNTAQNFTWCSANHQCSSIGGELVNSHSSISMLIHNVSRSDWDHDLWVGLSDIADDRGTNRSGWQRVNGRGVFPLDENLFRKSDPSGGFAENCLRRGPDRLLADFTCTQHIGFICEFVSPKVRVIRRHISLQLSEIVSAGFSPRHYCFADVPAVLTEVQCAFKALLNENCGHVLFNSKTKLCRMLLFTDAQVEQEIADSKHWEKFSY